MAGNTQGGSHRELKRYTKAGNKSQILFPAFALVQFETQFAYHVVKICNFDFKYFCYIRYFCIFTWIPTIKPLVRNFKCN